ncbi:MAG: acyl carrier protein [Thermodesulfobacteriota bacterium]
MQVAAVLKKFIEEDLLEGRTEVGPEENLFTSKLLDSLDLVELVAFIEETFGFRVGAGDIRLENFDTLALMEGLVRLKLEAARAA